jgi:hypothetical protein
MSTGCLISQAIQGCLTFSLPFLAILPRQHFQPQATTDVFNRVLSECLTPITNHNPYCWGSTSTATGKKGANRRERSFLKREVLPDFSHVAFCSLYFLYFWGFLCRDSVPSHLGFEFLSADLLVFLIQKCCFVPLH